MALYSPLYSNIRSYFNEYDELDADQEAYSQGLLSPAAPAPAPYMAPQSLLSPDAGQQAPQVRSTPVAPISIESPSSHMGDSYEAPYQSPNDPSLAWNDELRQRAALIERLKAGEQMDGWRYDPGSSGRTAGDSELDWSTPEGAWNGNEFYFAGSGAQQRNEGIGTFLKDAAKLAAVMGTAYLGGTALAGMGGTGAAAGAGAGAGAGGISAADAALAMGMGETAVGGTTLGTAGTVASTLAPEVIASTVAPEVAGSGLLAPSAGQTITITGAAKAAAAAPWWAPVATAATALPIINSLATPSTPTPDVPDPNANETDKFKRQGKQPGGDLGNMGGPGTPTLPSFDVSPGPFDQLKDWARANPQLAKMMFTGATSLLSASGGGGGGGGYVDSGYRPTISRGGFQARVPTAPTNGPTGLLNPSIKPVTLPSTGQANDGLWRYGLLGPGRG